MIMLSEKDLQQINSKGISKEQVELQLNRFVTGFPFLTIVSAASTTKGILMLSDEDKKKYEQIWQDYVRSNHVVSKFVPASGAASRMFKDLFSFLDAPYEEPTTEFEKEFFDQINTFAFYASLDAICMKNEGKSIAELVLAGDYKSVVRNLLDGNGLSYGSLPKGLLEFHKYNNNTRTPVEEHMVEGAQYAAGAGRLVNLHFTVSPEHKALFKKLVSEKISAYEEMYDVKFDISFSEQKSSTDTIAVNEDNTPFRDNGELLFRPGGHGALIENLNDLDSDVIFVKNIDNTIPDRIKDVEVFHKKVLAGVLVATQSLAFSYLQMLETGSYTHEELLKMLYFLQETLNIKNPETKLLEDVELALYIKGKLDRPMRVCGMVKNEGEPGGGPYFTVSADGTAALQILEASQIDMANAHNVSSLQSATHFNPVDLVCAVKNYQGQKFDLSKHIDPMTGFISNKSKDGKSLKALELPGLWNGAMSDWNTIFVEVPIETFNPVKTINDLLRTNHL